MSSGRMVGAVQFWCRRAGVRRSWLGVLAMLVAVSAVEAQERGTVTGRVTDADSGAPLGQVQVYLPALQLGSLSRPDGRFMLLNVPPGTHEIRADRIGLESASAEVTVVAGTTAEIDLQLSGQALALDEIVVTGTAGAARQREIGNTVNQTTSADRAAGPQT